MIKFNRFNTRIRDYVMAGIILGSLFAFGTYSQWCDSRIAKSKKKLK